jgi:hypothetical protein
MAIETRLARGRGVERQGRPTRNRDWSRAEAVRCGALLHATERSLIDEKAVPGRYRFAHPPKAGKPALDAFLAVRMKIRFGSECRPQQIDRGRTKTCDYRESAAKDRV